MRQNTHFNAFAKTLILTATSCFRGHIQLGLNCFKYSKTQINIHCHLLFTADTLYDSYTKTYADSIFTDLYRYTGFLHIFVYNIGKINVETGYGNYSKVIQSIYVCIFN